MILLPGDTATIIRFFFFSLRRQGAGFSYLYVPRQQRQARRQATLYGSAWGFLLSFLLHRQSGIVRVRHQVN